MIRPDGRCEEGRPLYPPGAHCNVGHRNFIGIGVCLVGNFSETEVPEAQLVGLVKKVVQLMEAFKLGVEALNCTETCQEPPRNAQDGISQRMF